MVTCKERLKPVEGKWNTINAEGAFVLPVAWLLANFKAGFIKLRPTLFTSNAFTDEVLVNLLSEWDSKSMLSLCQKKVTRIHFIVNQWNCDKQWYEYSSMKTDYHYIVQYPDEAFRVRDFNVYTDSNSDDFDVQYSTANGVVDLLSNNCSEAVQMNSNYWNILRHFSRHLVYTKERDLKIQQLRKFETRR